MALLEKAREDTAGTRFRAIAGVALVPPLVGYSAIAVVLAFVTATAPRAAVTADGVLAAALPGWLAAHQVPLIVQGRELGALPLLPTLLLALLVGRVARSAAERIDARGPRETGWIAGAVVLTHAVAGLAVALVLDGPVEADPLAGFYYPALISGFACAVALARRSGLLDVAAERVDPLALRGLRAGLLACAALAAVGAAVVVFGLATSFSEVVALHSGGAGAAAGLFLLSLGYLPNAVAAGLAFAAGPGFALGEASVAPLDFTGGTAPAVPLLGALPSTAQVWWPVLLLLPAAVGALVGWVLREVDESPAVRLRAVAVAAVVVALGVAVVAGASGGALAGGPFDPLDLRAAALSLALVGWIGLPGAAVAWFAGTHPVAAGLIGPDDDDAPAASADEPDTADEAGDAAVTESAESPESTEPAESAESAEDTEDTEHAGDSGGAGETGEGGAEPAESAGEDGPEGAGPGVSSDTDAADQDR